MEKILNFRDVGNTIFENNKQGRTRLGQSSGNCIIKPGVLFRGAQPDETSPSDAQKFIELGIRTIIDLRSGYENVKPHILAKLYPTVPILNTTDKFNDDKTYNEKNSRKTIKICLAGRNYQRMVLANSICNKQMAAKTIGSKVISPMGLGEMYSSFLEGCHDEIREIFEIMIDCENFPMYVHCAYGKDRTGFIIALVLSLCGVDDEIIIQDYSISQENLKSWRARIVKDMGKLGLSEDFAMAKPEAMHEMLMNLKIKYGSTADYLSSIGFSVQKQNLLKNYLCK
ncbi:hypothetical protein G9A89_008323 [Geosiphon pyriformis]|nr:hypothetical protein G9A89_008323 [Geosiphon pyriformis]